MYDHGHNDRRRRVPDTVGADEADLGITVFYVRNHAVHAYVVPAASGVARSVSMSDLCGLT